LCTPPGKAGPVVLFARNRLCALVKPRLAVTADNLLERMLSTDIKLDASSRSVRRLCVRRVRQGGSYQGRQPRSAGPESPPTDWRRDQRTAARSVYG
jgi:hypothetical protein